MLKQDVHNDAMGPLDADLHLGTVGLLQQPVAELRQGGPLVVKLLLVEDVTGRCVEHDAHVLPGTPIHANNQVHSALP